VTRLAAYATAALVMALATAEAGADTMAFKLLPNYSRATFKSDAPLETFVGNTAAEGVDGTLTLDPARPQAASGSVKVDMTTVRTGIEKRDADMRSKNYLDTEVEANRWVTFEVKSIEIAGPLEPGKTMPAKVKGILTVKQKPVERVADATVTWIKLSPEEVETSFTDHGLKIPAILFYKVSNDIQLETDLTFVRQ
jgi:polyisoprenoid-binding protein YceI